MIVIWVRPRTSNVLYNDYFMLSFLKPITNFKHADNFLYGPFHTQTQQRLHPLMTGPVQLCVHSPVARLHYICDIPCLHA